MTTASPHAAGVLDDAEVERALVVSAHPDDHDFGAAGTIALWRRAGIAVTLLMLTDGQAGGFDEGIDRAQMPELRRREQTAAARELGVGDVRFAGYVDGDLEPSHEVVRDIVRVIRQVRPRRMMFQSSLRRYDRIGASHPDHLAAGEAAIRALYPFSRNPFAYPELLQEEGLRPWTVEEMWIAGHPENNHVVDVTDAYPAKEAALRCHASQHVDPDETMAFVRQWLTRTAQDAGLQEGRYAEAFAVYPCG